MTIQSVDEAKKGLIKGSEQLLKAMGGRGDHANLSAKVDDETIVITKESRIGNLNMDSFAVVRMNGTVIEGEVTPSTAEVIDMHTAVYKAKKSVNVVMHNHAFHATTFAVAHQSIPVVYEAQARFGITKTVPVVPFKPRGSQEGVEAIIRTIGEHPEVPVVLLANHGILAFGSTPDETVRTIQTLDEAAELILMAKQLGGAKPMNL